MTHWNVDASVTERVARVGRIQQHPATTRLHNGSIHGNNHEPVEFRAANIDTATMRPQADRSTERQQSLDML